jgi:hypothetical protein
MAACTADVPHADDEVTAEQPINDDGVIRPWSDQDSSMPADGEAVLPPERLLAPVLADAGQRSGMTTDELVVTGSWRRTWSDGSLGCPRPGEFYTQALVPGWQVVVRAGERELDYRLSDRGHFILCEQESTPGSGLTIEQ